MPVQHIVHTALAALSVVLRQYSHQTPVESLHLYMTKQHNSATVTYSTTYMEEVVEWASFANADEAGLMQVYQCIMSLPLGAGLTHPQGVLKPMDMPQLDCGSWHVRMPLASHNWPRSEEDLPRLLVDVLHGLASLHAQGIGHRNVRAPNILQTVDGAYVLMDFEHCGQADAVPPFQPLRHWPQECRLPRATYSKAADIFSLGNVMRFYPCRLFSQETGPEGKRNFVVSTYAEFWRRYAAMLPHHRHCLQMSAGKVPEDVYM